MTDITEDLYEVLGVDREASEEQIHEAYNKLYTALDEEGPNIEKKKKITFAHTIIGNNARRYDYDIGWNQGFDKGYGYAKDEAGKGKELVVRK